MKRQLWHIACPKNVHRQMQWWAPALHHLAPAATAGTETPGELLLSGELSDGRPNLRSPVQVPKGFLAVYVGSEHRRFVIPASYLSMPNFKVLMDRAAEEYGFEQEGGLQIPCQEEDFEEILMEMRQIMSKNKKKNWF